MHDELLFVFSGFAPEIGFVHHGIELTVAVGTATEF